MKMYLEWGRPVPLKDGYRQNLIYVLDADKLPKAAGVYVFGRRRKNGGFEALYVGKANDIGGRVSGHQNNLRLMRHLETAREGAKVVRAGVFRPKPGQKVGKCLPLIERALIRYFLSEGHDLANLQGTRLGRHEVTSEGRHPNQFVPRLMLVS